MAENPITWTIHDLDAMPEDNGWNRYEIINGKLFTTPAPHILHQMTAGNISVPLAMWADETGAGMALQTPGIVLTETDAVIPDVIWASEERVTTDIDENGHFSKVPELIAEVLSTDETQHYRDQEVKLKLYAAQGVQEYWIVNRQLKEIEVYRQENASLQKVATLLAADTLTSPLLPGFECPLANVFPQ